METGEEVEIYTCYYDKELNEMGIPCYPYHPDELEKAQYILWNKFIYNNGYNEMTRIRRCENFWQEIQIDYLEARKILSREEAIKKVMVNHCISDRDPHNFGVKNATQVEEEFYQNDGLDEAINNKMLLYFLSWECNRAFPDEPLYAFNFINIKTGNLVKLYYSMEEEKKGKGYGAPYYGPDTKEWEVLHYIIWKNTNSYDSNGVHGHHLYKIDTDWEDIRKRYYQSLKDGNNILDTIKDLLNSYREADTNPYDIDINIKYQKKY